MDIRMMPKMYRYTSDQSEGHVKHVFISYVHHIAKTNRNIDWAGDKVVHRENNQRIRQVKKAIRIS